MIAELHGKISGTGSNLSDRLEDKLTGNVFGTLRYLPFWMGMAQILKAAHIESLEQYVGQLDLSYWDDCIQFWPHHERGELDIFLEFENAVVGIEVKYLSGLSSDDGVDNSGLISGRVSEESNHQLARESWIVKEWGHGQKAAYLIFVANDSACVSVYRNTLDRNLIAPGVSLGFISWQEILIQLSRVTPQTHYHKLILDDLIQLLERKGFGRFSNFELTDCKKINADVYFGYNYTTTEFTFRFPETIRKGDSYEYR